MKTRAKLFTSRWKFIIICFFLAVSLTSCVPMIRGMAKKRLTEEKGAIPPEFGQKETTLLILLPEVKFYDKKIKKTFPKYYTGEIRFITEDELYTSEFNDHDQYQYVLKSKFRSSTTTVYTAPNPNIPGSGGYTTQSSGSRYYYIIDRQSGKEYMKIISSSFTRGLLSAYSKNLEKKRRSEIAKRPSLP